MARLRRDLVAAIPRHVIQRGNNRTEVFTEHQDYHLYLKYVRDALDYTECALHAYVLMTNHVHLVVTPKTEAGVSALMQHLGRRYVRYFNDRHERTGTLWEGRFRAALIRSDAYLMNCMRYVELNPVRAGMVAHPREYRWSSYRANAGEKSDDLITTPAVYDDISPDLFARGRLYAKGFDVNLDDAVIDAIRRATNRGGSLR